MGIRSFAAERLLPGLPRFGSSGGSAPASATDKAEAASFATLTAKLADIQAAQAEADNAIRVAEANAATIRELAYDQARAITERAYRHGYDKGQDRARAQHAILRKYTPKPDGRNPGRTNQTHHGYAKDIAA